MSDAVWVAAAFLFVLFGLPFARRSLSVAFACGLAVGGTVMFIESLVGVRWNVWTLLIPAIAFAMAGRQAILSVVKQRPDKIVWPPVAGIFLLALYTAATARMTCGDLLYFWGPKAVHFFEARQIDVAFLKFPHYYLMHPDYPPLQPLVYVWSSVFAGRMSYWGAVLLAPFFIVATATAFHSFSGKRAHAILLAALLAFGFTAGRAAGGADPMLILFETVAISALTFDADRSAKIIAAIALAGAAMTKVEGAAFVIAVVIAYAITQRRILLSALPSFLLLGTWIAFARHHEILDSYGRAQKPLYLDRLGYVLYMTGWKASYRVMWLPWIASIAALPFATSIRRAALPLLVALISVGYTIFFYIHEAEPLWWINASAERVLLTPLVCLVVASASASE